MDINEIKENVAGNLTRLRNAAGLTQMQLAEKLNYTDKAISKWERGESVPDVAVLKQLADLFGVTVDWLISDHKGELPPGDKDVIRFRRQNKLNITLLSAMGVCLIATVAFFILKCLNIPEAWLAFVWMVPVVLADVLIFNAVWGKYMRNFLLISALLWTALAAVYLTVGVTIGQWMVWSLFLIGIPLQLAIVFWSRIRVIIHPEKRSDADEE